MTSRQAVLEVAGAATIAIASGGWPRRLTYALETDPGNDVGAGGADTPPSGQLDDKRNRDRARYAPDGYQLPKENIDEVSGSDGSGSGVVASSSKSRTADRRAS